MPVSDEATRPRDLCGKWLPRKKTTCARGPGHGGYCRPEEYMEKQRERVRAMDRPYDPVAAQRWRSKTRLTRYGLTQKTFDQELAAQGYACAMCLEPFEADQRVHIDHDHSLGCHPGEKEACDRCRRGLLCMRCNTALGFIEKRLAIAQAYLARFPAA